MRQDQQPPARVHQYRAHGLVQYEEPRRQALQDPAYPDARQKYDPEPASQPGGSGVEFLRRGAEHLSTMVREGFTFYPLILAMSAKRDH